MYVETGASEHHGEEMESLYSTDSLPEVQLWQQLPPFK